MLNMYDPDSRLTTLGEILDQFGVPLRSISNRPKEIRNETFVRIEALGWSGSSALRHISGYVISLNPAKDKSWVEKNENDFMVPEREFEIEVKTLAGFWFTKFMGKDIEIGK
jgi:hypothetical protein